ncbi:hypothetical protein [Ornithinibacillus scapharcae]|uniref:hypothetical protein n=1 Tax=Ornithinibacillus scapharcae TaxID=1147159 RepID=UPI000225BAC2|nr:hypothetical protein [Ornithinibacillus scapharcae]
MLHQINRTAVEMKMMEMRRYAIQANLAKKSREKRKKTESVKMYFSIPFLRSKKAS